MAAGEGAVVLRKIQPAGKRMLAVREFLCGNRVEQRLHGDVLAACHREHREQRAVADRLLEAANQRLGVELALETPDWALITAGSWGDRWDFSVGSMTITSAREEALDLPVERLEPLEGARARRLVAGHAAAHAAVLRGPVGWFRRGPGR